MRAMKTVKSSVLVNLCQRAALGFEGPACFLEKQFPEEKYLFEARRKLLQINCLKRGYSALRFYPQISAYSA